MSYSYTTDDEDSLPTIKTRPRGRTFELWSAPPSCPPTPPPDTDEGFSASRTGSIMNLTSSTLDGIYGTTGYDARQTDVTPWKLTTKLSNQIKAALLNTSNTPEGKRFPTNEFREASDGKVMRRRSTPHGHARAPRRGFRGYVLPLVARITTLAAVGVCYGLLISHLHDHQQIAPVQVELNRSSLLYYAFWAIAGVLLGEALPRADKLWASDEAVEFVDTPKPEEHHRGEGAWDDVLRSMGAFVGVAYAIRKLSWESTLQLSLTLAMANPALWYIIDRSPAGFVLSTTFALSGTAGMLLLYPGLIPSPSESDLHHSHALNHIGYNHTLAQAPSTADQLVLGMFSQESIGVATWIASVLFVSSVCFGNVGRRLAPSHR